MSDKDLYREFCETEDKIPIYSKDWWMDAVCGEDNWDVILIKDKNDEIIASLPYYLKRKYGLKYITQPPLTQTNGLYIKYSKEQKLASKLSYEKEIIFEIDDKLKELGIDYYNQNFHYSFLNWQPFYWKGYSQTTRYTYVIRDLSDLRTVFSNFSKSKRKYINENEGKYRVYETDNVRMFYELNRKVFERQGLKIPYSMNFIIKLDQRLAERQSRVIFAANDEYGNVNCMLYLVFDKMSSYLLMSGTDPERRDLNLKTLLVWEAIKFSSKIGLMFDFEGSMMENVATFFREFGAEPIPYHSIWKNFSTKAKIYNSIHGMARSIYHTLKGEKQ